jgi:hypothetical protein
MRWVLMPRFVAPLGPATIFPGRFRSKRVLAEKWYEKPKR